MNDVKRIEPDIGGFEAAPDTVSGLSSVTSPCIRICCLDESDICLGCFRSLDEIKDWQASDSATRTIVLQHCAQRRQAHDERFPGSA